MKDLVKLGDVGVVQQLQDQDLAGYAFDVQGISDLLLLQGLDGHLLAGELVHGEAHLAERALPDSLALVSTGVPTS